MKKLSSKWLLLATIVVLFISIAYVAIGIVILEESIAFVGVLGLTIVALIWIFYPRELP